MTNTPALFSPFDLHGITLQNRIVLAPMTRARAGTERMPNSLMARYYEQRSSAGLIITEATSISTQAIGWQNSPGIWSELQAEAWKKIVDTLHAKGTPIFLQLWHCGRASHSAFFEDGRQPVSASAIAIQNGTIHTPRGKLPFETPRPLETHEIPALVEDYRKASVLAKQAGFDGVEVHSANGYLLDQFLQSKTNHRTDAYGGSIENRFRLHTEILQAIGTVWPMNRIAIRFSPNGAFNDMGSPDYRETFLYAASRLDSMGIAYLHLLDGLAFGFHKLGEPMTLQEFRSVFHGPIMGNCGYDQNSAHEAIANGHADLIAIGRPYISNPDLVERYRNGWPLNPPAKMDTWYSFDEKGYTDYPVYQ